MTSFYGKYRGKVANNVDPQRQGRLQVTVPSIYGSNKLSWAMPCVPYAGAGVGLFLIPANNTNVWVEFEGGDINYPIWSGCFWGTGELPSEALTDKVKLLKTEAVILQLADTPGGGGVIIEAKSPAVSQALSLKFDSNGVTLTNSAGKIVLSQQGIEFTQGGQSIKISSSSVNINNGNVEIM